MLCLCFSGNQGYGSHNTGSTAENAKSYVPGTDANRESRYEQGRDTGRDSSYTGSGNQGYGSGNTGSNTGGRGVASYVPGTEANRQSRAEHGQDPNRYTGSGNQGSGNQGSGNQGYSSNTSSGQQWHAPALPTRIASLWHAIKGLQWRNFGRNDRSAPLCTALCLTAVTARCMTWQLNP